MAALFEEGYMTRFGLREAGGGRAGREVKEYKVE